MSKAYGVYWPEWNANVRATFIVDRAGTIRFVERYDRGQLPDPDHMLAEVKKLAAVTRGAPRTATRVVPGPRSAPRERVTLTRAAWYASHGRAAIRAADDALSRHSVGRPSSSFPYSQRHAAEDQHACPSTSQMPIRSSSSVPARTTPTIGVTFMNTAAREAPTRSTPRYHQVCATAPRIAW